jgi:lysozyme family protein
MAVAAFQSGMAFILSPERDGHKDDRAPGEKFMTNNGITDATWNHAVAQGIVSGLLTDMTHAQCLAIYRANFWNAMRCDAFPPGVALVLFVDATLMGVGHVTGLLQRIVGARLPGCVGPETIGDAARWRPADLVNALIDADEVYLATLANAPLFIRGWTRREEALRKAALALT